MTQQNSPDSNQIALLLGKRKKAAIFNDYIEHIANKSLLPYKAILQYGAKQGESLYTHVLNGILVLETLREDKALQIKDIEARVLYTAFTVHDINKVPGQLSEQSFSKLATAENISTEIERLELSSFFPDWKTYLNDIESLIRGHSGHYQVGGEMLFANRSPAYGLPMNRVEALINLMQAADIIDLSHTLTESSKKESFLSHLNTYLANSSLNWQYEFITHQLTEQRGLLTNIIHNGIREHLNEQYKLIPLLYYPNGVAYLKKRGQQVNINQTDITTIAKRIAASISDLTTTNFYEFINSTAAGIKVDAKCLELDISFSKILNQIYNLVQRRNLDPEQMDIKVREKAQRGFDKIKDKYPKMAKTVEANLAASDLLISSDIEQLRLAELVRSYYVFLQKHFKKVIPDPWERICKLLDLPEDKYDYYAYFDALYSRAYVLALDLKLSEEDVYQRLLEDGQTLTEGDQVDDPKVMLFSHYLNLYTNFSQTKRTDIKNGQHLAHYVSHQHKQCVHCSGPFPTDKWMTADVRSDITVQAFSNRLRGGPGEPKKYICAICHLQFMLEKLNYTEIRGEKTIYLHLFPYSFTTGPFIEAIRNTINSIIQTDTALKAINLNVRDSINEYLSSKIANPKFRKRTKKDKPQPYGLYLTRYSETVSNLFILPLNPSGGNDTEQFLFALWNALLLQRHFGMKVLLSNSAVAPLDAEHIPDLYVDNIPLSCQGLLSRNDYIQFVNQDKDKKSPLQTLWQDVEHIFKLSSHTFVTEDTTPRLVRALLGNPLNIFYQTEKLLEARARRPEQGGLLTYLFKQSIMHVETLSKNRGGSFMTELSTELKQLAALAWKYKLKGSTLKKNSLMFPVSEVFRKLRELDDIVDLETVKAATAQDIFDHIDRISEDRFKPGRTKHTAIKQFVEGWFEQVLDNIYGGNHRKLLNDEKLIRSAYHFYIREQIPDKSKTDNQ